MFKVIAIGVGTIIAGILAFATTRPDTFRVERSIMIAAPPENVYPFLTDFREWPRWSPWEKLDPEMQRSYGGSASGEGAVYEWNGNRKAGAGRMEIVDASEGRHVEINLTFLRPFVSSNTTEFTLTPKEDGTLLRWQMHGPAGYMSKLMTVFASFDKMIGPDFDRGLESLKHEAESRR
jgi:uncharacterized protein YndB with AHSA1/START domain